MHIKEKFDQKLLVEGNDDQHVIWSLCQYFNINESFDVIDSNGIENLIKQIPIRLKQSNLFTLGIVLDADTNIIDRWNSVKTLLSNLFNIPDNFPNTGLIMTNEKIKIGIWIMPNNGENGMLEDFIQFLIPSDDELILKVNVFLEELENLGLNQYKAIHKSKAKIHNWLSLQEDPGTPMGLAITKKYLSTENNDCQSFIKWINDLFN
jgi:hypothetical protein